LIRKALGSGLDCIYGNYGSFVYHLTALARFMTLMIYDGRIDAEVPDTADFYIIQKYIRLH
jgi:hypothetical protein